MLAVALVAALAAAAFLAARYALLKRSLRQADRELGEIVGHLEDNRIVRLPAPDADLEALLGTVNRALAGIRAQAAACARHEAELKAQVEHVSHDLRTPLTSIRGYLALVDDAALDAEAREALGTVRRKAASLERLVAQFYELSRLQGDDVPPELGPVDVGRMLRESVAEQYRLLADRGLDVRLDVPEHAVLARANGEAVERVLANLLHNAGKYAKTALEVSMAGRARAPRGPAAAWRSSSPTTRKACPKAPSRACSNRSSWRTRRVRRRARASAWPSPAICWSAWAAASRRARNSARERAGWCSASSSPQLERFSQIVHLGKLFRANGADSRYYDP